MNRYFGLHTLEGEWHALLPRYLLLSERATGRRILDIGCGSGIGSSLLLELGAEFVDAIDHRPAVLELARMKHAKQGLDFHVMFWEELDFEDDTFDLVLCLDPSSPVTDPSLIQEVQRVLKPGGEYVCAIERKQIEGLEVLLPRYGYAEAAESIEVHPHAARPPQVGELQSSFERAAAVIQRPSLSFVFEAEGRSDAEDGSRIPLDDHLQRRDADEAAVEIWFCGSADAAELPRREVRLPYFGLVERLRQVHGELQMAQVRGAGAEDSIFDDIVDSPEDDEDDSGLERERQPTNEFRVVSFDDEMTTSVRNDLGHARADGPRDQLEGQLNELAALYQQVRHDFQSVVRDAHGALQERDRYIEHLVNQVHELQERYRSDAPVDDLDEMTNVFDEKSDPGESGDASDAEDDEAQGPGAPVAGDEAPSPAEEPADGDVESDEETP